MLKMEIDHGNQDFISNLPIHILTIILSKLRIDEAVRCDVLSKKWLGLWKETSHLEFDAKHMVKPLTRLSQSRDPRTVPDFSALAPPMFNGVCKCNARIILLILSHFGALTSCRYQHYKKSIATGDVETFVDFLVDKKRKVKDLSLECVPDCGETAEKVLSKEDTYVAWFPYGVFESLGSLELINYTLASWLPFQECKFLKNLKLKRIYLNDVTLSGILDNCAVLENFMLLESAGFERLFIAKLKLKVLQLQAICVEEVDIICQNLEVLLFDSILCQTNDISIYAPCLKKFHSYSYSIYARMVSVDGGQSIAKTHEILSHTSDFIGPTCCNIFQNLSTLSLDLDLNNLREAVILSFVFRLCPNLQVIEIALPVFRNSGNSTSRYGGLSYPIGTFWETRASCNCVSKKLKFMYMRGFRGKEHEVEFAKYLITRGTMMERVTIICSDSMEVAKSLLSLPRASADLFINLILNANNPMDEFAEHQNRLLNYSKFLYES